MHSNSPSLGILKENHQNEPETAVLRIVRDDHRKEIDFNSFYKKRTLEGELSKFIQSSRRKTRTQLFNKYKAFQVSLCEYSQKLHEDYGVDLQISYLEHSHYVFSILGNRNSISEEMSLLAESKLKQFEDKGIITPDETYYKLIRKFIKFISQLLSHWGIFDIHQYAYRYEGRSLSIKMVDMKDINSQCMTLDVLWFIYAINHKPFVLKINRVLLCYAKVLELSINQLIEFFMEGQLNENSFKCPSFWQKLIRQSDKKAQELYSLLVSTELAYRCFEKCLLEEFLKLI